MTVPNTYTLSDVPDNPEQYGEFLKDLKEDIEKQYSKLADGINGSFQWDEGPATEKFQPRVLGTTAEGQATYSNRFGWSYRQGVLVDIWCDVSWTAHTGTGKLFIEMPYEALNLSGTPFVGSVQADDITITGDNLVANVIPGSFRCEIWENVSGASSEQIDIASAGRLIVNVRYIAREAEQGKSI